MIYKEEREKERGDEGTLLKICEKNVLGLNNQDFIPMQ